ncbi:MAG: 2OG-Fe(II) oxygenase [Betaproteobacteria bacterium]|nr:2OG-Fe(II) oxygenase [Betaproteobacteria bacterium]
MSLRWSHAVSPVLPIDVSDGLSLDANAARTIGESLSESYCFAEPFPHIVADHFLPEAVARAALEHFPRQALNSDKVFEMGYAGLHKRQVLPEECDAAARQMFHFFNSRPMLEFLEGLSSIPGLIPDPYFTGGGFHETARGGKLGIHADFRINEQLHLHRRLNVIIYLNEGWKDEWGGALELWDRDMKAKRLEVAPLFNRCVIFNTDADSFHGHPDPLQCPEGVTRRSIALYYYTASESIYRELPNQSTMYQARPGDSAANRREARDLRLEQHLRQWVPPALLRYVFALKRRLVR